MKSDRQVRRGGVIVLVTITCAVALLLASEGWGVPGVPLWWFSPIALTSIYFDPDYSWLQPLLLFASETRYILIALLVPLAYGSALIFGLVGSHFGSAAKGYSAVFHDDA